MKNEIQKNWNNVHIIITLVFSVLKYWMQKNSYKIKVMQLETI